MHWGAELIGRPWIPGARGPEAFDCWGLVAWVYKAQFGIELPSFPGVHPDDHKKVAAHITEGVQGFEWTRLAQPEEGCVVAMGKNLMLHHVGIWLPIDGGLVLHASVGGVVAQKLTTLRSFRFHRIEFYKHHGVNNRNIQSIPAAR